MDRSTTSIESFQDDYTDGSFHSTLSRDDYDDFIEETRSTETLRRSVVRRRLSPRRYPPPTRMTMPHRPTSPASSSYPSSYYSRRPESPQATARYSSRSSTREPSQTSFGAPLLTQTRAGMTKRNSRSQRFVESNEFSQPQYTPAPLPRPTTGRSQLASRRPITPSQCQGSQYPPAGSNLGRQYPTARPVRSQASQQSGKVNPGGVLVGTNELGQRTFNPAQTLRNISPPSRTENQHQAAYTNQRPTRPVRTVYEAPTNVVVETSSTETIHHSSSTQMLPSNTGQQLAMPYRPTSAMAAIRYSPQMTAAAAQQAVPACCRKGRL